MQLYQHTIRIPPALINFTNMEATAKKDLIVKAKEAEEAGEFEQAAEIYEQVLKKDALEAEAYDINDCLQKAQRLLKRTGGYRQRSNRI